MHYIIHFVLHAQFMDMVRNTMELPPKRPSTTFSDLHLGFKNLEGDAVTNQRQGAGPSKNIHFSASCTIYGHCAEYNETSA
jgi:hypothetical protein